jgi:hypothetical protein
MWWWLVGLWLGGSILFVPILCLRELLAERRKGSVAKAPSQQAAEVDHASPRLLLASAIVASAPEG